MCINRKYNTILIALLVVLIFMPAIAHASIVDEGLSIKDEQFISNENYGTIKEMISIKDDWWAIDANGVKVDDNYTVGYTGGYLNPIKAITNGTVKIQRPSYAPFMKRNQLPGKAVVLIKGMKNYGYKDYLRVHFTIKNDFDFQGKSALVLGDSIQALPECGHYIATTCKQLNAKRVVNKSVSVATLASNNDNDIWHQIMKVDSNELGTFDYYFIAAGTNDANPNSRTMLGDRQTTDSTTTCGALNKIVKYLNIVHKDKTGHPAKIIVVTPIGRFDFHKEVKICRKLIAETANQYDYVKVVNGEYLATDAEMSIKSNTWHADGVHPNRTFALNTIGKRFLTELNKQRDWFLS